MKKRQKEESLAKILKTQSLLKQDVYEVTKSIFNNLKKELEAEIEHLRAEIKEERVRLKFENKGDFEAYAFVGSDALIFNMHTNVFCFPKENSMWKTSYVEEDPTRAYCGVINIYNFLADSFLHGRLNDPGYLIGRIFINKEKHFIVEGKGKLGFLFRDFINGEITTPVLKDIVQTSIKHAAEFDLLMPPFDIVNTVSVMQIQALSSSLQMKTGKRLGFKFKAESSKIN